MIARHGQRVPLRLPLRLVAVDVEALVRRELDALRVRVLVTPALRAGRVAEDAVHARHGVEPLTRLQDELARREWLSTLWQLLDADRLLESELGSVKVLADDLGLNLCRGVARRLKREALGRLLGCLARVVLGEEVVVPLPPEAVHELVMVRLEERVIRAVARADAERVRHLSGESSIVLCFDGGGELLVKRCVGLKLNHF